MKNLFAAMLMSFAVGAMADGAPPQYQTACFACHSTGAAGAPKAHDVAAWNVVHEVKDLHVGAQRDGGDALGAGAQSGLIEIDVARVDQSLVHID